MGARLRKLQKPSCFVGYDFSRAVKAGKKDGLHSCAKNRIGFQGVALMKGTGFSPSVNHCKMRAALAAEGLHLPSDRLLPQPV
jgi:hypothetical protein